MLTMSEAAATNQRAHDSGARDIPPDTHPHTPGQSLQYASSCALELYQHSLQGEFFGILKF
jgi:hypothetical protein